jgi:hypothetical protein
MLFMARSVRETEAKKSLRRHIQKKLLIAISLPWANRLAHPGNRIGEPQRQSAAYFLSGRAQRE